MRISRLDKASEAQLEQVTRLHMEGLGESFLTKWGDDVVREVYRNLLRLPSTIMVVGTETREIVGFGLATSNPDNWFMSMVSGRTIIFAVKALLSHPSLVIKTGGSLGGLLRPKPYFAELQFLVLEKAWRGKGWGTKLVAKIEQELRDRGVKEYAVGTKASNRATNKFYNERGWKLFEVVRLWGEDLNYYKKSI